jgi:hypothetical protein
LHRLLCEEENGDPPGFYDIGQDIQFLQAPTGAGDQIRGMIGFEGFLHTLEALHDELSFPPAIGPLAKLP